MNLQEQRNEIHKTLATLNKSLANPKNNSISLKAMHHMAIDHHLSRLKIVNLHIDLQVVEDVRNGVVPAYEVGGRAKTLVRIVKRLEALSCGGKAQSKPTHDRRAAIQEAKVDRDVAAREACHSKLRKIVATHERQLNKVRAQIEELRESGSSYLPSAAEELLTKAIAALKQISAYCHNAEASDIANDFLAELGKHPTSHTRQFDTLHKREAAIKGRMERDLELARNALKERLGRSERIADGQLKRLGVRELKAINKPRKPAYDEEGRLLVIAAERADLTAKAQGLMEEIAATATIRLQKARTTDLAEHYDFHARECFAAYPEIRSMIENNFQMTDQKGWFNTVVVWALSHGVVEDGISAEE